jgi:hypothetical protein
LRVNINAASDTETVAIQWRDARLKSELAEAIRAAGHDICYEDDDISIWFHGLFTKQFLSGKRHVAWIISHPKEWLNLIDNQRSYSNVFERVYCASPRLTEATRIRGIEAEYLPCPAPRRPLGDETGPFTYDLALIGNGAAAKNRDLLAPLFAKYKSLVVGTGWGNLAKAGCVPWADIPRLINCAKLYIHTAYPDMRAWGIMPDNVLDAAANTRALVLHDSGDAAAELPLPGPTFTSYEQLEILVDQLLGDDLTRSSHERLQRANAQQFVGYEEAAAVLLAGKTLDRAWLETYSKGKETDISGHLVFMHDTVMRLNAHFVLELGVRSGESSRAFLTALAQTGGKLFSVDTSEDGFDDPLFADLRAACRTFVRGDSCAVALPDPVWDIVFIDTAHTYDVTLAELRRFGPRARCILLHDWVASRPDHGVEPAVRAFMAENPGNWTLDVRPNHNGLATLERT